MITDKMIFTAIGDYVLNKHDTPTHIAVNGKDLKDTEIYLMKYTSYIHGMDKLTYITTQFGGVTILVDNTLKEGEIKLLKELKL